MDYIEQRVVTKYLRIKEMTPTPIHQHLVDTPEESAVSYDIAKMWCCQLKYDRQLSTDEHAGGASTTATTQEIIKRSMISYCRLDV
ncbi:hypothetical protein Trydic_g22518 [Trypoxylus dichotomus]